ncbi:MAG: low affinity iron permease family protein [Acidimicrobiia bacterium]
MDVDSRAPVGDDVARGHNRSLRVSARMTDRLGSAGALAAALVGGAVFVIVGAVTGFGRAWELAGTLGIPFGALVALIALQHTQNHHDRALQLKLDELLRSIEHADVRMVAIEDVDEHGLVELQETYRSELVSSDDADSEPERGRDVGSRQTG